VQNSCLSHSHPNIIFAFLLFLYHEIHTFFNFSLRSSLKSLWLFHLMSARGAFNESKQRRDQASEQFDCLGVKCRIQMYSTYDTIRLNSRIYNRSISRHLYVFMVLYRQVKHYITAGHKTLVLLRNTARIKLCNPPAVAVYRHCIADKKVQPLCSVNFCV
jgi:hypothetical protein